MNIKEKYDAKDKLECEIAILNEEVKERWKELTGSHHNCYFHDWYIEGNNILINYRSSYGDMELDEIPIRFFEIDGIAEAIIEYAKFLKEERVRESSEQQEKQNQREREEYEKLKKKFEG